MKKSSSKEFLAVVLVAGLAVVLFLQLTRGAFSGGGGATATRATGKEVDAGSLAPIVDVSLQQHRDVKIRPRSRNLFNYAKSPEVVRQEEEAAAAAVRAAAEAAERERVRQEAEAKMREAQAKMLQEHPPDPPAPGINFRFIGKVGDSRAPLAILEEAAPGGEKYVVHEGEVILDRYKILKIDYDSVTMGYTNPIWQAETKTIKMGS